MEDDPAPWPLDLLDALERYRAEQEQWGQEVFEPLSVGSVGDNSTNPIVIDDDEQEDVQPTHEPDSRPTTAHPIVIDDDDEPEHVQLTHKPDSRPTTAQITSLLEQLRSIDHKDSITLASEPCRPHRATGIPCPFFCTGTPGTVALTILLTSSNSGLPNHSDPKSITVLPRVQGPLKSNIEAWTAAGAGSIATQTFWNDLAAEERSAMDAHLADSRDILTRLRDTLGRTKGGANYVARSRGWLPSERGHKSNITTLLALHAGDERWAEAGELRSIMGESKFHLPWNDRLAGRGQQ